MNLDSCQTYLYHANISGFESADKCLPARQLISNRLRLDSMRMIRVTLYRTAHGGSDKVARPRSPPRSAAVSRLRARGAAVRSAAPPQVAAAPLPPGVLLDALHLPRLHTWGWNAKICTRESC